MTGRLAVTRLLCRSWLKRRLPLLFLLLVLAAAMWLRAGHALMIPLAVYDVAPDELQRGLAPVALGVPVPARTELTNLANVTLVGAELAQFTPMSFWPDGSIRWLFIDAMVRLSPGQTRASLYLTTGQPPERISPLAEENEDEIALNTGAASFHVPKQGDFLLRPISAGSVALPQIALRLVPTQEIGRGLGRSRVWLEKNGPVAAVVAVEDNWTTEAGSVPVTTRFSTWREQALVKVEVATYLSASAKRIVVIPLLDLIFTGLAPHEAGAASSSEPSSNQRRFLAGTNEVRIFSEDPAVFNGLRTRGNEQVLRMLPGQGDTIMLRPGMLLRREILLDLRPGGDSGPLAASSLLAKAASVDAYNDAATLVESVVANPDAELPALDASASFEAIQESIYGLLSLENPQPHGGMGRLKRPLDDLLRREAASRSLPGEALSLWSFLAGDTTARNAYVDWGAWFQADLESNPEKKEDVQTLLQLVDLYRVTGREDLRNAVWQRVESWLPQDAGSDARFRFQAATSGRALLVLLSNLIEHGRFDESIEDRLLDALGLLIYWQRDTHPNDLIFSEGYRLTGNPSFLKAGQQFLADKTHDRHKNSLRSLFAAPQRQYVWRELRLQTQLASDGSVSLSWTVPPRAERVRIKHASGPIDFGTEANGAIPFHRAENMTEEPAPLPAGEKQSMVIPASAGLGKRHFAARYLERGPALPAPAPAPMRPPALAEDADPLNWNLSLKLVPLAAGLLALALVLRFWSKRAKASGAGSLLLAAALFGSACHETPPSPPQTPPARRAATDAGSFEISYKPAPDPIPLNEHFSIEVLVTPRGNTELPSDLSMSVDADMPAHGHGINTAPRVRSLGANRFLAEGLLFHMPGEWELYIDVARGPVRERATFPLAMK